MEIDKYTVEAMEKIINYMHDDEQRNYEENPSDEHIFNAVTTVAGYLDNLKRA